MTTETIQLTDEQQNAVNEAWETLTQTQDGLLTIGGFAGTGKTTLLKAVLEKVQGTKRERGRHNIAVSAFTGKATSVLHRKGIHQAQTLHSLMYEVSEGPDKQPVFTKKRVLGEPGFEITGIIVDEASMISQSLYDDLLSYGLPVVFVGDHGQLEPVGDNPNVMENPEIRLETIHRQASNSPILKLAHAFREGQRVLWNTIPPNCGLKHLPKVRLREVCTDYDIILCGFNGTRNETNRMVRKKLGRTADLEVGEKLICLKNNRQRGTYNGMQFVVKTLHGTKQVTSLDGKVYDLWTVLVVDDVGRERLLDLYLTKGAEASTINPKYWGRGEYPDEFVICDYGYCITVHKSQGSEYDKVLVIEEIWFEKWNPKRWRYTAATRASKELTWVNT